MHGNRLVIRKTRMKIFALQHPCKTVASAKADYFIAGKLVEPFAVEVDFGFFFVEDFENLFEIRFGVRVDLLARERGASFGLSRGVTDHCGEIADQKDSRVTEILKVFEFAKDYSVSQMDVRGCRVHAEVDAQGLAGFYGFLELGG